MAKRFTKAQTEALKTAKDAAFGVSANGKAHKRTLDSLVKRDELYLIEAFGSVVYIPAWSKE